MVYIEEGALGALEQDRLSRPPRVVEEPHGRARPRTEPVRQRLELGKHIVNPQRDFAEKRQLAIVLVERRDDPRTDAVGVEKIGHAKAPPRDLVLVGRADFAPGGADLRLQHALCTVRAGLVPWQNWGPALGGRGRQRQCP